MNLITNVFQKLHIKKLRNVFYAHKQSPKKVCKPNFPQAPIKMYFKNMIK